MPMYYPDLGSVQRTCKAMAGQPDDAKKYRGLYPETEEQLPQARIELGQYFRRVWGDKIAAIEVEQAADEHNYQEAIGRGLFGF